MTDHAGKTEKEYPFRRAERCLYDYLENVARLEALRADLRAADALASVKGQAYDGGPRFGGYGDPVSARLERIEEIEREVLYLERWTRPIERLMKDLSSLDILAGSPKADMLRILQLRYLGANTWKQTKASVDLSERTFSRRRKDLVNMAGRYMGLKIIRRDFIPAL